MHVSTELIQNIIVLLKDLQQRHFVPIWRRHCGTGITSLLVNDNSCIVWKPRLLPISFHCRINMTRIECSETLPIHPAAYLPDVKTKILPRCLEFWWQAIQFMEYTNISLMEAMRCVYQYSYVWVGVLVSNAIQSIILTATSQTYLIRY